MRRNLAIVAAAVLVAAGGLAWFMAGGLGPGAAEDAFREWAEAMRAAGYEVAAGGISGSRAGTVLEDLTVAKPSEGWRWTGPEVVVSGSLGGGGMTLRVSGTQVLTYRAAGEEHTAQFGARSFQVTLERGESGNAVGAIGADASGLVLRPPGGGDALVAARVQARVTLGAGELLVPDGTTVSVQIDEIVLPGYERSAFGNRVQHFSAALKLQRGFSGFDPEAEIPAWQGAPNSMAFLTGARLEWGLLNLQAEGTLRLDDQYRPLGTLDARVYDIIPAVQAMAAAGQLDIGAARDFAVELLEGLENRDPQTHEFALRFRDGDIVLREDEFGLPLVPLGAVGPLFGISGNR